MSKKYNGDVFSRNLFENPDEPENPNAPELLHENNTGEAIDNDGNVYDENGNLIREKPDALLTKALEIVRREYPDIKPNDPLVQFYLKQLRSKK